MIKLGNATITQVARHPQELIDEAVNSIMGSYISKRLQRRLAAYKPIELDPDRFLYIRNRAISADETWGANQNEDGFPSMELKIGCRSFINAMLDIDHDPSLPIGTVLDSFMIPKAVIRAEHLAATKEGKQAVLTAFKSFSDLKEGDQIVGDWIENVWAVNKQSLEGFYPKAVEAILDGEITDTSMGMEIRYSMCTVCDNKATDPEEFCEHIGKWGVNKGSFWDHPVTGHKVKAYERCFGIQFFEDALIMPEAWNRVADSQGADIQAVILQVLAAEGSSARQLAGQLRLLANRMSEADRKLFAEILGRIN